MRDALLQDLMGLHDVQITVAYDPRFPLPADLAVEAVPITPTMNVSEIWDSLIAASDAVWCIAPETHRILEGMYLQTIRSHKVWIGCDLHTIQLGADKWQTYEWLQTHGISSIQTCLASENWQPLKGPWVAKLRDGAGCEDSGVFDSQTTLEDWLSSRLNTHIVQPYVTGTPASLSMLCHHGHAYLLSANQQLVDVIDGEFIYRGSRINGCLARQVEFQQLASRIAKSLPQCSGYLGVDVILTEEGTMPVLELNPRLTTSYVGLHRAIGLNPAKIILDMHYNDISMTNNFVMPQIEHNTVDILLHVE